MKDLTTLSIRETHEALLGGEFSVSDLVSAYMKVIEERNPDIKAYIEIYDDIDTQVREAEGRFKNKTATLLTGIPIAVKDNILVKGKKVTAGSHILEGHTASFDATVIARLRQHAPIFLGRTNMDEFAMGSSTETSFYGVTRNPHDRERTPGGSSGGSAAAVAMNGALVSLGSDTGGSIRQPAAVTGLVGLKPTYGAVSRYGLIAMGSSLDQIGPLARNVEDVKIIHEAIKGEDALDSTTLRNSRYGGASTPKKTYTIGVPENFVSMDGIDEAVLSSFRETIENLRKAGHTIKNVNLPFIKYSLPVYYILMPAESSTNLARFDGVKYGLHVPGKNLLEDYMHTRGKGFGKEVRRRIVLGAYVLSSGYLDAYYNKALQVREKITEELETVFKEVDMIATPTTPTPAFRLGEKMLDPLSMYLADIFTVSANISGVPAISIPQGTTEVEGKKLPIGFQLIAPHMGEDILFDLGGKIEKGL